MNSVAIHWSAADICLASFSDLVARGCEVPLYLDELTQRADLIKSSRSGG